MPKKNSNNNTPARNHPWRNENLQNNYPTTKLANYVGDPLPEIFDSNYGDLGNFEHAEKIC